IFQIRYDISIVWGAIHYFLPRNLLRGSLWRKRIHYCKLYDHIVEPRCQGVAPVPCYRYTLRRAESRDTNQKYVQQVLTIFGQLFPVTKPDASLGLLRRAEEYGALRRSGVRYLRRSSVRQLGCAVDRARAP
ncbi:hypothetical protein V5799_005070, partial [Amblyomma americanum]